MSYLPNEAESSSSSLLCFLLQPFPYLVLAHRVFNLHVLRSCASSIFIPFSFMSFLITSLHFSFCLTIFRCPPTSIFHVIITTSSVFHSTWPNHLSLASLILSLVFATFLCSYFFSILFIPLLCSCRIVLSSSALFLYIFHYIIVVVLFMVQKQIYIYNHFHCILVMD